MIEAIVGMDRNTNSDTYVFSVEVSGLNMRLATGDERRGRELANFLAGLIVAEVERTLEVYAN
jgi:hypothetical protein